MTEQEQKALASQLRQPHGEEATVIAERMNKGNAIMNRATLEYINAKDNMTVLEIGMGNGYFITELLQRAKNIQYTGLDFSAEMIAYATELNKENVDAGNVEFVLGDVQEAAQLGKQYDSIFTVNTIYFWKDPNEVLQQLHTLLKVDGELIITIRPKKVMQQYPFVQFGFTMYSKEELNTLLEKNNWKVKYTKEIMEPEQFINGVSYKVESLLIKAVKKLQRISETCKQTRSI
jgi:ubiquinone/menaquinone biosynthesis C-methylase UbiE